MTTTETLPRIAESARDRFLRVIAEERENANGQPLTQLNLRHRNLEELPPEIVLLADEVEKLELAHNDLVSLPPEIAKLSRLRYLSVRSNKFKTFPLVLCNIPNLEILDISRNKIPRLPSNFGSLMSLKVLSVSRNRLKELPAYIGEMEKLRALKLDHNPLEFPPKEILSEPPDGDDMSWLNRLKGYLRQHKGASEIGDEDCISLFSSEDVGESKEFLTVIRANRSPSFESLVSTSPDNPKHSLARSPGANKFDLNMQRRALSISNDELRLSAIKSAARDAESDTHHKRSTSDEHQLLGVKHHSRALSQDSVSSVGSQGSTTGYGKRVSEAYFQRKSRLPPSSFLSPENIRLIEASRSILFALMQTYSAARQCVKCCSDTKLSQPLLKVLDPANNALQHLTLALDRLDQMAQSRVPDANTCQDVSQACVACTSAFRQLVVVLQQHMRVLVRAVDSRLLRHLLLITHGSIAEVQQAWESLSQLLTDYTPTSMNLLDYGNFGFPGPANQAGALAGASSPAPASPVLNLSSSLPTAVGGGGINTFSFPHPSPVRGGRVRTTSRGQPSSMQPQPPPSPSPNSIPISPAASASGAAMANAVDTDTDRILFDMVEAATSAARNALPLLVEVVEGTLQRASTGNVDGEGLTSPTNLGSPLSSSPNGSHFPNASTVSSPLLPSLPPISPLVSGFPIGDSKSPPSSATMSEENSGGGGGGDGDEVEVPPSAAINASEPLSLQLRDLARHSANANEMAQQLQKLVVRMRNNQEEPGLQKKFYVETNAFVKAIVKTANLVKTISLSVDEFQFPKSTLAALSAVTRSTKEVAILLSISSFRELGVAGVGGESPRIGNTPIQSHRKGRSGSSGGISSDGSGGGGSVMRHQKAASGGK
ncbi:uncharacterized protein VTP21DRAFT_9377 [Calcarisporiella thermophila]|uniref:uncharacterized protein n=1 Tax=Calcarisporiella thermophila TaxID=911321 RepID=UPI0037448A87